MADWDKLAPTFHRLVPTKANEARQKADNFATWVKQTPGLEDIASNDDKIIAVAQHYGLATTLLDFTTEPAVAGYFAADGGPPPEGMNSCIICINLDEAFTIWDSMKAIARTPRSS